MLLTILEMSTLLGGNITYGILAWFKFPSIIEICFNNSYILKILLLQQDKKN
jgi:hypothetical protein